MSTMPMTSLNPRPCADRWESFRAIGARVMVQGLNFKVKGVEVAYPVFRIAYGVFSSGRSLPRGLRNTQYARTLAAQADRVRRWSPRFFIASKRMQDGSAPPDKLKPGPQL